MLDETTQEKPAQKSKKNVPIASDVAPQNTQTDTPGEITLPETTTPLLYHEIVLKEPYTKVKITTKTKMRMTRLCNQQRKLKSKKKIGAPTDNRSELPWVNDKSLHVAENS